MSETSEITRPLVAAINALPFCFAHRLHAGKVKVRGGYMQLEEEGTPDVLVLLNGRAVYFETKTIDGRLRPSQVRRHRELRRMGYRVEVPRSFPEAMDVVRTILEEAK